MTARHKLLLCCFLLAICPPFLYCKLFCRQDGGIAIPPFAQHHIYASLVKGEVLSPEKIRATTGGIVTPPTLPKPHYPSRFSYCNRLYALICFRIGTIPLAFCRVSVCVSLYGFVFALSLPLFVGEELAPPVAPNTAITTTVAKSQPPLASHQPFQTRTIPRLAPHSWLPCQRELDCDKAISYYKSQHSAIS